MIRLYPLFLKTQGYNAEVNERFTSWSLWFSPKFYISFVRIR